jgi:hypothetical protein
MRIDLVATTLQSLSTLKLMAETEAQKETYPTSDGLSKWL